MLFCGKVSAFVEVAVKFSACKLFTRHLSKMVTVPVKTSIGCLEFGRQCATDQVEEFVNICMENGVYDFDTAYMYAGGKTEEIMGNVGSLHSSKAFIATKANPWTERDHKTPIEETLEAVGRLHKEGKFKSFGLSNYAAWQVAEIYYLCKKNNYPLPTVYQGMYNSVTRQVEGELFPCLRRFGIAFYAYNPLAGGLLTGKHRFEDRESSTIQYGRYAGAGSWVDVYLKRYWKKHLFNSIDKLRVTLDSTYGVGKVSLIDASLRWMYHHSKMDGANGDAVIIGASSVKHLKENLESTKHGPLHQDVVEVFDEAWSEIQGDCPLYFR
ncbi:aflatoxin B1 aldehyde reductase member 2-like isoform X2 [Montipora capricornis]|uniref:aflatoxin B1 aldehyde reductase member 2-like isoform X2 n=1 Tax=Montipora capricornis TaxID=246305 RepID=UPI0035F0FF55